MSNYTIYIKNTDSILFEGIADNADYAIDLAKEAYADKYPEEVDNVDDVEWSVVESDE